MNVTYIMILDIHSIAILLIICFHALKVFEEDSLRDKLYLSVLYTNVFLLVIDILSRFDGHAAGFYPALNHIGNFVMFLMSPVLPSLWLAYVHYQVFCDEKRTRRLFLPLGVIFIINAVILIFSQFFGLYYYFDSNNVYQRVPLFFIPVLVTVILLLTAYIIVIVNRRNLGRKSFFSLIFFALPPVVGIILQVAFYGFAFILNSVVLSLLVIFLNMQNYSVYTDYLTGLNNRKKLDMYLKKKVSMSAEGKTFSAILIDINNFKHINDTYGHDAGDKALEIAAKLLKSCIRTGDFIARFGGDEFIIIADISDKNDLEAFVIRINKCFDNYNKSASHLYELEFSVGYAVYDCKSHKSAAEFLKQIDILMYEDKQAYHKKHGIIKQDSK